MTRLESLGVRNINEDILKWRPMTHYGSAAKTPCVCV